MYLSHLFLNTLALLQSTKKHFNESRFCKIYFKDSTSVHFCSNCSGCMENWFIWRGRQRDIIKKMLYTDSLMTPLRWLSIHLVPVTTLRKLNNPSNIRQWVMGQAQITAGCKTPSDSLGIHVSGNMRCQTFAHHIGH